MRLPFPPKFTPLVSQRPDSLSLGSIESILWKNSALRRSWAVWASFFLRLPAGAGIWSRFLPACGWRRDWKAGPGLPPTLDALFLRNAVWAQTPHVVLWAAVCCPLSERGCTDRGVPGGACGSPLGPPLPGPPRPTPPPLCDTGRPGSRLLPRLAPLLLRAHSWVQKWLWQSSLRRLLGRNSAD